MNPTRTCLFALCAALFVTLSACGGKEGVDPAPEGPPGPPASATSVVPPPATVVSHVSLAFDPETGFAAKAFPPPMPNTAWHESTWTAEACLECHATGEDEAPIPKHEGLPDLVGEVACRACHVVAPDE